MSVFLVALERCLERFQNVMLDLRIRLVVAAKVGACQGARLVHFSSNLRPARFAGVDRARSVLALLAGCAVLGGAGAEVLFRNPGSLFAQNPLPPAPVAHEPDRALVTALTDRFPAVVRKVAPAGVAVGVNARSKLSTLMITCREIISFSFARIFEGCGLLPIRSEP